MQCVALCHRQKYEAAYGLMLAEGDDMYLLHLIAKTGPVNEFLQLHTAREILNRLNAVVRSNAFETMELDWI